MLLLFKVAYGIIWEPLQNYNLLHTVNGFEFYGPVKYLLTRVGRNSKARHTAYRD